MTPASHLVRVNTEAASERSFRAPLQLLTGFFFAFRLAVTYIAFQANPRAGSIAILACSALLVAASLLYTLGDDQFSIRFFFRIRMVKWLLAYLLMSGASLLWTGAESLMDASALWAGMVMEVAMVLLLVKQPDRTGRTDALFKGFVVGMLVVGAAAWTAPTLPDLRIGDYEFLHPNMIGMYSALGFFLAQHLALKDRVWKWACLALGLTILRTISKTSILAFFVAESFYLLRERRMSRRHKIQIGLVGCVIVAAFATLLESYFEIYTTTGSGTQAETLTGRTAIWTMAFLMGIEKPWIGHGFYSFRALVPAFGSFEPWHAHNELPQEFFEYGLLGVAVTAGLYLALISSAKQLTTWASCPNSAAAPYARLVSVVVLFAIVHGLAESVNFGLTIPLWLFAALALALAQPQPEAIAS